MGGHSLLALWAGKG